MPAIRMTSAQACHGQRTIALLRAFSKCIFAVFILGPEKA